MRQVKNLLIKDWLDHMFVSNYIVSVCKVYIKNDIYLLFYTYSKKYFYVYYLAVQGYTDNSIETYIYKVEAKTFM